MWRYQKSFLVALLMIATASAGQAQVEKATAKLEGDI